MSVGWSLLLIFYKIWIVKAWQSDSVTGDVHILVSLSLLSIFGHCPLVKFLEKSDRVTGDVHNSSLLSLLFSSQLPTFAYWIWKKSLTEWQCDRGCTHVSQSVTLVHFSPDHLLSNFWKRVTKWQRGYTHFEPIVTLTHSRKWKKKQEWPTDWRLCNISNRKEKLLKIKFWSRKHLLHVLIGLQEGSGAPQMSQEIDNWEWFLKHLP